jgi:hypothetical protein
MHERYNEDIAPIVSERWAQMPGAGSNVQTSADPTGPFRAKVAWDLFSELPEDERAGYAARAKQEAMHTRERYEEDMKKEPSKAPEDRQACVISCIQEIVVFLTCCHVSSCIDGAGSFLGPILQGIHERTGLHATVVLGGPIPSYGGELKTI